MVLRHGPGRIENAAKRHFERSSRNNVGASRVSRRRAQQLAVKYSGHFHRRRLERSARAKREYRKAVGTGFDSSDNVSNDRLRHTEESRFGVATGGQVVAADDAGAAPA